MTEKIFLCRPCAERLKDFKTVKSIKYGQGRSYKDNCEQCGCRRFGTISDIEFRLPEKPIPKSYSNFELYMKGVCRT